MIATPTSGLILIRILAGCCVVIALSDGNLPIMAFAAGITVMVIRSVQRDSPVEQADVLQRLENLMKALTGHTLR